MGDNEGDIKRFLYEFHSNRCFPKGCNSSFISLIPKVKEPQNLGKYHPISLVGCMYKILTKIPGRRLKKVLPRLIDQKQSAFLEGRNIHSVEVTNEVVEEAKRKKKKYTVF